MSALRDYIHQKPIHLITDGGKLRQAGKLLWAIEQALRGAGGKIGFVQLREQVSDEELESLARQLKALCDQYESHLILNRKLNTALQVGASGVHLGGELEELKPLVQKNKLLFGYSAHSVEEVECASAFGFDYVFLSPIFSPVSKSDSRAPLGASVFRQVKSDSKIPVFALGGITPDNANEVLQAGADGVACIGSILGDPDPLTASQSFAFNF